MCRPEVERPLLHPLPALSTLTRFAADWLPLRHSLTSYKHHSHPSRQAIKTVSPARAGAAKPASTLSREHGNLSSIAHRLSAAFSLALYLRVLKRESLELILQVVHNRTRFNNGWELESPTTSFVADVQSAELPNDDLLNFHQNQNRNLFRPATYFHLLHF